ncbi:MAG: hypothetical protein M0031_05165 [Thermaerobacter sp.]|nr:hypothetical protein [Thermaerobacter sp.]
MSGMADELAAAGGPEGPTGPEERVSPTWLILQRLEDLRRGQEDLGSLMQRFWDELRDLRGEINAVRGEINAVRGEINAVRGEISAVRGEMNALRNWSLGLLLLAVLGLLAKLLIPGA